MRKTVTIIGAGMAGLLAASILKRKADVRVLEKAASLPNNHHAVLRFRSDIVAQATGIKFRKVRMIRTSIGTGNEVADSMAYSMKCNGKYTSDRSITSGTVVGDRFIAPSNFISQMYMNVRDNVAFDVDAFKGFDGDSELPGLEHKRDIIISTVPMPVLMHQLGYDHDINFGYSHGSVLKARLEDCDAFVSVYNSDPFMQWSRASVTGNELVVEFPRASISDLFQYAVDAEGKVPNISYNDKNLKSAIESLGIKMFHIDLKSIRVVNQKYSKILPIDDEERLSFIHWATDKFGIYSLGRFATWRPNLLLDDLVHDINLIDKWTDRKSRYSVSAHR